MNRMSSSVSDEDLDVHEAPQGRIGEDQDAFDDDRARGLTVSVAWRACRWRSRTPGARWAPGTQVLEVADQQVRLQRVRMVVVERGRSSSLRSLRSR